MVPTDPLKLHRELLYEMHSRLVAHLNGAQEPTANDRDSQASDTLDLQAEEPDEWQTLKTGDTMRDFKELAQQAWNHYQSQPGIVSISIDGNPPSGLRYGFASESAAERFLSFRELHNSYEPVHANTLRQDGADVVEVWR